MGRLNKLIFLFIIFLLSTSTSSFGQLTTDQSRALLSIQSDTESMQSDIDGISNYTFFINENVNTIKSKITDLSLIFGTDFQNSFQEIHSILNDNKYDFHDFNGQSYLMQINDLTAQNYNVLTQSYSNSFNTLIILSKFYNEFKEFFDTQNTHYYDYFNQVYYGVDGKGGLLPINNQFDELNTNFVDFWQWLIDYYDYNQYSNLSGVMTNSVTQPIVNALHNISLTNSVDLTLLENNTSATTNLLHQLLLTQEGYTNQLLSTTESTYEYEVQGEETTKDSLELTAYSEQVYLASSTNVLVTPSVEYSEYDFSFYTNLNSAISILSSSYELQQALNQTNQLTQFSTQIQNEFKTNVNEFDNFSKRSYSSKITWRFTLSDDPYILDLSNFIDFGQSTMRSIWDFTIWILSFYAGIYLVKLVWEKGD